MVFRMTNKENLYRPGISGETLETHQIVRVDEKESKFKTGIRASGLLIPYFCCKRKLVWCNSHDFFRIRLDDPIEGMKYHQRKGSGVHPYLPLGLWDLINEDVHSLVVVEGEFKALSLIEAGSLFFRISETGTPSLANDVPKSPRTESPNQRT